MHPGAVALVSLALGSRYALANWPFNARRTSSWAGFKPEVWCGDGE